HALQDSDYRLPVDIHRHAERIADFQFGLGPAGDMASDTGLVTRAKRTHRDRPPVLPDVIALAFLKREQRAAAVVEQSIRLRKLSRANRRDEGRPLNRGTSGVIA